MTREKFLLHLLFLFIALPIYSQTDKEFWFVGPEASSNHGERPVYMRISTMDEAANITLRMPANNKFVPVKNLIPANTTFSIRLDEILGDPSWLDSIENRPPDMVLRKGFLLTSDKYVTAYYEINNTSNPAIFPMKGKNGVGLEFYIPGQTDYVNQVNDGSEAFDIVATTDTTVVTITPSVDIVGHPANVPFQVVLNKGESFSVRTLDTSAPASLAGSHVAANKPVAITISDDSIVTGGWDIIGDQLIPVNLLGKEYIAIKGYANNSPPANNDERVYILAVQDGTDIFIDGSPLAVATLNAGEQYNHGIPSTEHTALVKSSKPVLVYHLSGHSGEAGASILPHDSCTGSRKIGFNRSSASAFAMMILTRSGNQDFFLLNGSGGTITGASFIPVPGTGGNWVYYRQNNMTTVQVPVGANLLENTNGKFHLGILNNVGASSEYGYFSDFSTLYLGADAHMCPGDSVVLDGGPFRNTYEWKRLVSGNWVSVGNTQTYTCHDTGYYACQTNGDFCTLFDTIQVSYYPNGSVNLGPDTAICEGTAITLNPGTYQSYEWSDGTAAPQFTTSQEGTVWVRVTNNNGCVARDTVVIQVDSLPLSNQAITGADTVCQGQAGVPYSIATLKYAASYQWSLPPGVSGVSATNAITADYSLVSMSGSIAVKGVNTCGVGPSITLPVNVKPLPGAAGVISMPQPVCQGATAILLSVPVIPNTDSYGWSLPTGFSLVSGNANVITVSLTAGALPGTVSVYGTNSCGSGPASSAVVPVQPLPVFPGMITGAATVCQGATGRLYQVAPVPGADTIIWSLPPGALAVAGAGTNAITVNFDSTAQPGTISARGRSFTCGDGPSSQLFIQVNPLPQPAGTISGAPVVCQGQQGVTYSILPLANTNLYQWNLPPGALILSGAGTQSVVLSYGTGATGGIIRVNGSNVTCGAGRSSTMAVTVNPLPLPAGVITGPAEVCQAETRQYSITNPDSNTISYQWNLSPPEAGTILGTSSSAQITWSSIWGGNATLSSTGVNGCGTGPASNPSTVKVNFNPVVTFVSPRDPATTKAGKPLLLKEGQPGGTGGWYEGPGVSQNLQGNWVFDPASGQVTGSSAGYNHVIKYFYRNAWNCVSQASANIKVYSALTENCPGNMTDVRDGHVYPTFTTGSGPGTKCWMAANLNYGSFIPGNVPQTDNFIPEKHCPGESEANCSSLGGYYQWMELMAYHPAEGNQGICPPAWHIPTYQEWKQLINNSNGHGIAGNTLKDLAVAFGFHGRPTGLLFLGNSWNFTSGNNTGSIYWSSTQAGDRFAAFGLNSINPSVSEYFSLSANSFQVRCVKD